MTREEVATMINSIGKPYTYYQFPEGTDQAPPFVCFFFSQSDDLYADNSNYQGIEQLNVELYTREKDFVSESRVETVLKNNGLTYHKYEAHLDDENLYQIAYEMEVLING